MLTTEDEKTLISRLRSNEEKAFQDLLEHYRYFIKGVLIRKLYNQELIEDAFQNFSIKVYSKFHLYNEKKGRLSTWLKKIAENEVINLIIMKPNKVEEIKIEIR